MVFGHLAKDILTLIKENGLRVEGIKAIVTPKQIIIPSQKKESLPVIDPRDLVQRKLSNGGEETYVVNNPKFFEGMHGVPPFYELEVRKLGIPEAESAIQNTTYNVTGDNARINQNTVDHSVNVVQQLNSDVAKNIENLRLEINRFITDESRRSEALGVVDTIEDQFKSGSPKQAVVRALVSVLPSAGNIASIGSLLLTCFS